MKKKIIILGLMLFFSIQQSLSQTISIDEAVLTGIENNPKIQADKLKTGLSDAEIKEAGLRLNPKLYLDATFGKNEFKGGFEQSFELGGKRKKRVVAAELQKAITLQEIASEIIDLRCSIRLSYIKLYAAKERLKTANEIYNLTEQLTNIAKKKEIAGQIAMLDVLQAEIEHLKAKNEIQNAELEETTAFNILNNKTGCELEKNIELKKPDINIDIISKFMEQKNEEQDIIEYLVEQAYINRPELKKLQRSIDRTIQLEKLAKATVIPNITLAAGPNIEVSDGNNHKNTEVGVFTTMSIDLPVFDHGQSGVMQAKAQRRILEKQIEEEKNNISIEIKNCYSEFLQTEKSLKLYEAELLPKAKDVLSKSSYSFTEGKSDILTSLNAQEAYIKIKTDYINTLECYYNSLGNLEKAIGAYDENL